MPLTPKQKSYLRSLAHKLKPVVIVGNAGLTEAVINEIDLTLAHHELIKIKLGAGERLARDRMCEEICTKTNSDRVQTLGRIATIYRGSKEPAIKLP